MRSIHICLLSLIIVCSSSLSFAHPPRDVQLTYDGEAQVLKIRVNHVTPNTLKHYIRRVVIKLNDKEVNALNFPAQSSRQAHEIEVPLELKAGDTVTVSAVCNVAGSKEVSLQIK